MTLKEGIEKLGTLIAGFNKEADPIVTTEQKFVDAKLNDGVTIIRYEADVLATGVVVSILDETGAALPLPAGDYILEDGTTFTIVDDLGTADNVVLAPEEEVAPTDAAAPAAEMPMAEKPAATAAPKRVIKSQVEEHVFSLEIEGVEPISVDFSSMFKAKDKEITDLKELNKQMFEVVKQLSELPASAPTEQTSKQKFSVAQSRAEFLASQRELEDKMSKENIN